jgi:hypothetical protein
MARYAIGTPGIPGIIHPAMPTSRQIAPKTIKRMSIGFGVV